MLLGEVSHFMDDELSAERLRALGHPARLAILRALAGQERCCCSDVCRGLPLAQSTVSQHLRVLRDAGLVSFDRDGVRSRYVVNADAFAALCSDLDGLAVLLGAGSSLSSESV